ncbi:MAG: EF-Tu/IF-2/RF-3 family GTPase, partial [Candidatus Absconditabacterales bacterium]
MNISKALIFDCVYDPYKGVVAYVKVTQGTFIQNQTVTLIHSEKKITITEVGYFDPNYHTAKSINTGEIGYIITGAKSVRDVKIGDTIIDGVAYNNQYDQLLPYAIPGFRRIKPYVFAGVYPVANNEFEKLRDSFEKLSINDSAIEY